MLFWVFLLYTDRPDSEKGEQGKCQVECEQSKDGKGRLSDEAESGRVLSKMEWKGKQDDTSSP